MPTAAEIQERYRSHLLLRSSVQNLIFGDCSKVNDSSHQSPLHYWSPLLSFETTLQNRGSQSIAVSSFLLYPASARSKGVVSFFSSFHGGTRSDSRGERELTSAGRLVALHYRFCSNYLRSHYNLPLPPSKTPRRVAKIEILFTTFLLLKVYTES